MLTMRQSGVSLIELMIGLGIMSLLLFAGMPTFASWLQNSQNRTAAESIMNGLQLARIEAVRRNTQVRFDLTDATGRIAWKVGCVTASAECPATIQRRIADDGLSNARVGVSKTTIPYPTPTGYFLTPITAGTGLEAGISFNGMGRMVADGADISRVDVTGAAGTDSRRFVVVITTGGQIRMCDPNVPFASNPQGCS